MADEPVLYTQAGCGESAKVRAWLTGRGVVFSERNVSTDSSAAQALYRTGVFATPLLVVGEERVLGYRPRALTTALHDRLPPDA